MLRNFYLYLTRGRAPVPCRRLDGLPRLASSRPPSHGERSQPVPSHRTLALPSPNPTNTGRFRYSVSEVPMQLSNLIARPPLSRFEEPWADRAFVRVAVLIIFLFLFPFYFTLRNWGNCTVQCPCWNEQVYGLLIDRNIRWILLI